MESYRFGFSKLVPMLIYMIEQDEYESRLARALEELRGEFNEKSRLEMKIVRMYQQLSFAMIV